MLFNKAKENTMPQMHISKFLLNKINRLKQNYKSNIEENNCNFNKNYNKLIII
jgi:hypothetical protein